MIDFERKANSTVIVPVRVERFGLPTKRSEGEGLTTGSIAAMATDETFNSTESETTGTTATTGTI
jgi:hypothetical protein